MTSAPVDATADLNFFSPVGSFPAFPGTACVDSSKGGAQECDMDITP